MKVLHLKETLHQYDAIGDFESLYQQLDSLENELTEYVTANRHKNLQIKTALLEELKETAKSHEWKSASLAVKEIQSKWTKTGAVAEEHKKALQDSYDELIKFFYDGRAAFYADLDKMMADKEADFEVFLKKAEALKSITSLAELKTAIRTYTDEWKELGKIKPTRHNAFWEKFQSIVKPVLEVAKKQEKKKKGASTNDNQKAKETIIARLSEVNQHIAPDIQLHHTQKDWKAVGPVDKKISNELYDKYLFLIGSISEKLFLNTLVLKKSKKDSSEEDLKRLRVKLLRGLLERDMDELRTFEENLGNFSMAKGLDDLLGKKLSQQKRKVEIKESILGELKNT